MKRKIDVGGLTPLPAGLPALPPGWLDAFDAAILYNLARKTEGLIRILEIGSWVGRSSCMLAYGIRDHAQTRTSYDIVDYGIASPEEWQARFSRSMYGEGSVADFAPVVLFPGGTGALLKKNLVERDLARHVSLIILGDIVDYRPTYTYDVIFCDATHDAEEIRKNIPLVRERLQEDNFIVVCDDIIRDADAALVQQLLLSDHYYLTCESDPYSKMGIFVKGKYRSAFG